MGRLHLTRRLALSCLLSLLASASSLASSVVVGVTGIDDDHTVIAAIEIDGDLDDVGDGGAVDVKANVAHRRGYAPTGVVVGADVVALVLAQDDRAQGLLVALDLKTGVERDLLDEVMIEQRPALRWLGGAPHLSVVRGREHGAAGGSFDMVDVDVVARQTQIVASADRLWITPVAGGDDAAVMVIDGGEGHRGAGNVDGAFHIDVVDGDGGLSPVVALGVGAFRSPVSFGGRWLVERSDRPGKRASIVDDTGKVWVQGLPGLSPALSTALPTSTVPALLATSSGRKSGGVIVWSSDGAATAISSGRPGIARPLAVTTTSKGVVVVAWIDRGVSMPGELWAISPDRSVRRRQPQPQTAVSVYGVVDDAVFVTGDDDVGSGTKSRAKSGAKSGAKNGAKVTP